MSLSLGVKKLLAGNFILMLSSSDAYLSKGLSLVDLDSSNTVEDVFGIYETSLDLFRLSFSRGSGMLNLGTPVVLAGLTEATV